MTAEQIDLARRAVACKGWRWRPGMRYLVPRTSPLESIAGRVPDLTRGWTRPPGMLSDLTDPATLGCLLALVREAWGDPRLVAIYCEAAHPGQSEGWAVQCADNRLPVAGEDYPSEAEALVAALEAAP